MITSLLLISASIVYDMFKGIKNRIERIRRRLAEGRTEGKYFYIEEIHGKRKPKEVEEERPRIEIPDDYMGYIISPEGAKLKTPLLEIDVDYVPRTSDSVVKLPEYPVRVYTTVIEASTPMFRESLERTFSRLREIRRRVEEG